MEELITPYCSNTITSRGSSKLPKNEKTQFSFYWHVNVTETRRIIGADILFCDSVLLLSCLTCTVASILSLSQEITRCYWPEGFASVEAYTPANNLQLCVPHAVSYEGRQTMPVVETNIRLEPTNFGRANIRSPCYVLKNLK